MDLLSLSVLFAEAAPTATAPNPKAQMLQTVGMMVLMVVVFYFLLIRPQQKRNKDHQALLKTIKAGDKVLVAGGILGVVVTVKEKSVTVRSAESKLEVNKSAIGEILERAGESSES